MMQWQYRYKGILIREEFQLVDTLKIRTKIFMREHYPFWLAGGA
jgi:hypothetical protein